LVREEIDGEVKIWEVMLVLDFEIGTGGAKKLTL